MTIQLVNTSDTKSQNLSYSVLCFSVRIRLLLYSFFFFFTRLPFSVSHHTRVETTKNQSVAWGEFLLHHILVKHFHHAFLAGNNIYLHFTITTRVVTRHRVFKLI